MLRGYSPSKNRWKLTTTAAGVAAANRQSQSSQPQTGSVVTQNYVGGSNFGGANPNVYTRLTKHTPAHSAKA